MMSLVHRSVYQYFLFCLLISITLIKKAIMESHLHPGIGIARSTDSPESTTICSSIATKPKKEPETKASAYKEAKDKSESESTRDQGPSNQSSLRVCVPNEHPTSCTRDSSRCLDQTSDDNDSSVFEDIFYSPLEYSDDEELIFNPNRMEKLGSGGFGACYKTSRIPDGVDIAVKLTTIDDEYYDNAW
jgi:hypothetical protein